jgi:hypothetical protein
MNPGYKFWFVVPDSIVYASARKPRNMPQILIPYRSVNYRK